MPLAAVAHEFALGGAGYALAAVFGALFGSFANVCIYRMPPTEDFPSGRSVVTPASHCSGCSKPIRWYDNVPLLSYLWLRGKCRFCGQEFSPRYLVVELLTSLLFVLAYYHAFHGPVASAELVGALHRFAILAAFVFVLVVITFIDLDHKLILNKITYPAIPIFYGLSLTLPNADWTVGLIGLAVGYGSIRAISDAYYYLTGREGLGYGDGKLLAVVGALYGWPAVVMAVFAGSFLGSTVSIPLLYWRGRGASRRPEDGEDDEDDETPLRHVEIPFGPFLAAGALGYAFLWPWLHRILIVPVTGTLL